MKKKSQRQMLSKHWVSNTVCLVTPHKELQKKAEGEKVFPHVFGTDDQGRDIMVRVMVGARVSIIVGVCAALLVLVIGALYGSISGYCGGMVDTVMQRIVEIIYSIPEMLIILLLICNSETGTGTVPEFRGWYCYRVW